jgi:hypothetical protein
VDDWIAELAHITGPDTVWWFNGQQPQNSKYKTTVTLTGTAGYSNYIWKAIAGSDEVKPSTSSTNTVEITSKDRSPQKTPEDIEIQFYIKGRGDSAIFKMTALSPYRLMFLRNVDFPATHFKKPVGYESDIHYKILDQMGNVLPYPVPWNEHFTGPVKRTGDNWVRGNEVPGVVDPTDTADHVSIFADRTGVLHPEARFPVPGSNALRCSSPGQTYVDMWPGNWHVGVLATGGGTEVQTNDWVRFIDHARHCNLVSPIP